MGFSRLTSGRTTAATTPADYKRAVHRLAAAHQIVNRFWQDAPDIQPDYFPEYEAVQAWPWVSSSYQLLEQSFKLLVAVCRKIPVSEVRRELELKPGKAHHLDRLFNALEDEDHRTVIRAYAAYSRLYSLPIENAADFLALTGRGYTKWRYLPLEGWSWRSAEPHREPSLEIVWASISRIKYRVFGSPNAFPDVNRRLNTELEDAFAEVCNKLNTREELELCWKRRCASCSAHNEHRSGDLEAAREHRQSSVGPTTAGQSPRRHQGAALAPRT